MSGHYGNVRANQPNAAERNLCQQVEQCQLPDGIQLVYADDHGRRNAIALEDAASVDFDRVRAFRRPPAYRGQRNFPGWWWSATTRSHVLYESWLGRHHIIEADRDPRVAGIAGQPFQLTWPEGRKQGWHVPDLFCRMLDGQAVVTDCRPADKVDEKFRRKTAIVAAACVVIGWQFRLASEPDPVWAANLRWLAGYRHPRFGNERLETEILHRFTSPQPLAQAGQQPDDPIRILPVVFHLLWRARLSADLRRPLGPGTILTACADPLEAE